MMPLICILFITVHTGQAHTKDFPGASECRGSGEGRQRSPGQNFLTQLPLRSGKLSATVGKSLFEKSVN